MAEQRIVDRIARPILLPERYVHSANAHVEHPLALPKFRNIFEINVALPKMKQHVRLLPRGQIDLRKEIDLPPDRRLDKETELVHAKLPIGKEAVGTAIEESYPSFSLSTTLPRVEPARPRSFIVVSLVLAPSSACVR